MACHQDAKGWARTPAPQGEAVYDGRRTADWQILALTG
jgi:hypothetical protein